MCVCVILWLLVTNLISRPVAPFALLAPLLFPAGLAFPGFPKHETADHCHWGVMS